jgi:hypothetical protein
MDLQRRAEELACRTGVPVDRAVALARAGTLGPVTFERLVEAAVEAELRRGECGPEEVDARRRAIEALAELAAAGEARDDARPEGEADRPPPRR